MSAFTNTVAGRDADASERFESLDPTTGEMWAAIPRCDAAAVDAAIEEADRAFKGEWSRAGASERGRLLSRLADLIERDTERLAQIETRDNGKLIAETRAQVAYMAKYFRYFGGLADKIEGRQLPIDKSDMFVITRREPLGVIAAITPWNSPLQLLSWKLAPLLAAGNTVVVKPSEHTSASTLELAKLFKEAGFPDGVVNTVTGYPQEVGQPLISHPKVAKVAFTGGEAGGIAIYKSVAENLKRVTLELGGKSANIIFKDAILDAAVNGAVAGIFAASGQTCVAGSRLLVQRSIYDEVVSRLVTVAADARVGNPQRGETHVGPITTAGQRERVLAYIDIGKCEGASCVFGGDRQGLAEYPGGLFVKPTIFADVRNEMRIAQEEIFGPVLSVIPFDDVDDAISIANDTLYGLAAGVWTQNMARAISTSLALQAGTVWVNGYRMVSYMAPFGGYKRSGIGRENGQEAMDAYLQTKSVWLNLNNDTRNPFIIG